MPKFSGKTVIVTGSSSGIGREALKQFAKKGANVVVHGQNEQKLKDVVSSLEKAGVHSDRYLVVQGPIQKEKTRDALINETLKKFGRIDVLVNNAGIRNDPKDPDLNSIHNLDFSYEVNFRSVYDLNNKAYPHLKKTKGNIVNISSTTTQMVAPFVVPYVAMKAAMEIYSKGYAIMYGPEVRMNCVSPGPIDTDFGPRHPDGKEAIEVMKATFEKLPLRRMGTAEDMASVIVFVASNDAKFMTGSIVVADGGYLVGFPYAR